MARDLKDLLPHKVATSLMERRLVMEHSHLLQRTVKKTALSIMAQRCRPLHQEMARITIHSTMALTCLPETALTISLSKTVLCLLPLLEMAQRVNIMELESLPLPRMELIPRLLPRTVPIILLNLQRMALQSHLKASLLSHPKLESAFLNKLESKLAATNLPRMVPSLQRKIPIKTQLR